MANWNTPALSDTYSNVLNYIKDRDSDAVTLNHANTATNLPTNSKRWNPSSNILQNWNGSSWDNLTLAVSGGGTGLSSLTAGYIPYGAGTSAFASSANLTFSASTGLDTLVGRFRNGPSPSAGYGVEVIGNASTNGTYRAFVQAVNRDSPSYLPLELAGSFVSVRTNNGADQLYIDASGNVGIGTTSISYALHTYRNANTTHGIRMQNASTGASSRSVFSALAGSVESIMMSFANDNIAYIGTASNHKTALISNGSERIIIDTTGYIGIGVGSPSTKLHIEDTATQLRLTYTAVASYNFIANSSGDFTIDKDGTNRFTILTGGDVGIGGTSPSDRLDIFDNSFQLRLTYASDTTKYARFGVLSGGGMEVDFNNTSFVMDVLGGIRCDSFRIDATPSASAATTTHKAAVNFNGTTYYFLLSNV